MARRLLCCTDNLSVLPICGIFLALLGIVLFILYLVVEDLTSSLEHIDGAVPVWVPAILLLLTGITMILQSKKRPIGLLAISLCLSIASAVVCISVAVPTIINTIPLMESLTLCVYQQSMTECRCYVINSKQNGTTHISIPEGSRQYTFKDVKGCDAVERTLKDIVFTECVIYCFGAFACAVATVLTSMLLCHERKSNKSPVQHINNDAFENPNSHRFHYNNNSRLFLHGPGQTYIVGLHGREDQDRSALINSEVVPTEERTNSVTTGTLTATTNTTTTARNSVSLPGYAQSLNAPQRTTPVRRSSSSSSTAVPRPVVGPRHHSISAADSVGLATRRPGRPPPLVRGGFMQSHPDGRAVPVYTVPGSNQAYISLNDLPSLQLPNMDSVPAYVPRVTSLNTMQNPYPSEQPPPYSPSAEYPTNAVPPFPTEALTTVNESSESALSSPVRSVPDGVNAAITVDTSEVQTSPDVTVNDVSVDLSLNDNSEMQEIINESIFNENFTFSSGSNQSPHSFRDITNDPLNSNASVDGDYELNDAPDPEVNMNNLSRNDSDTVSVSLTPASQHRWNLGTSSRESISASLASLPREPRASRASNDNVAEFSSGNREESNENLSNKRVPKGARPKVKPKPGRQRKRRKSSGTKTSRASRLPDGENAPRENNNPVIVDSTDIDDTNFRSRTSSMPNLSKPPSVVDGLERTSDDPTDRVERPKQSGRDLPMPWAFDVGTIDGRRKKNKHRNTTAFYDLIERANNYQSKEVEKPLSGKHGKSERKRRSRSTENPGYNHTNPRQKAKIRTDLPASSAWGPKKNIPSISGRASKSERKSASRPHTTQPVDSHIAGLSSSSNESLTDVISFVANTSTSSTRARKKRVMLEAQSITELLDTRV